jgi:hypothetical protein
MKQRKEPTMSARVASYAKLLIKKSKRPSEKKILGLLIKECFGMRVLAETCYQRIAPRAERGIVFKSAVPRSKQGKALASARNDLAHARCFLQPLLAPPRPLRHTTAVTTV